MSKTESPGKWDHTGHNIGARDPQPPTQLFDDRPRNSVPGNAWCLDCDVPIAAHWSVDLGLKIHPEHQEYLTAIGYKPNVPPPNN
jgi:hypothetical protein